jgi:hypothetical protein
MRQNYAYSQILDRDNGFILNPEVPMNTVIIFIVIMGAVVWFMRSRKGPKP